MWSFGVRLKDERLRLKLNQTELAAHGGVGKTTQINYEKGDRFPDAKYLELVSKEGVDVLFVITGSRSLTSELSSQESALVENYRASSDEDKNHIEAVGASFAQQELDTSINQKRKGIK